ncbi:MAG: GIY-YIG nuclease family protein [bacterium]|nr:GIY-YIG nuclease family protein [bacterium]
MERNFCVYIITNDLNTVFYTGVTNDLQRRMYEHKHKLNEGFTKKYNIQKLVFYEIFYDPDDAIIAEKKIKGWTRAKKITLIKKNNPKLVDLSENFR